MPVIEAITNRDYGIGKPMEMIMQEAPNAGEKGHRVWQKGKPSNESPLSPYKEATLEEAIANSYMFVQISGVKGGSLTGNVADISTGLPWDRQSPMESCAEAIARAIAGENHQLTWFSPHKLLVFIEDGQTPEQMLQRLVDAPREPYQRELPHLSNVVNKLQNIRALELLYPDGNGEDFIDIFNGNKSPLQRAYQDNGKFTFVWGWENRDGQLWGVNLDNTPQSMTELAIDEETNQMLLSKHAFLTQVGSTNRYVIEVDFSATVSCCNIAFNAQQNTSISELGTLVSTFNLGTWESDAEEDIISIQHALGAIMIHRNNESSNSKNYCQKHNMNRNECNCETKDKSSAT